MKKLFFTLCALCLCGTMWADVDQTYGLSYTVSGDEATIVAPTDGSTYSNSNLATYTGDEVAEGVTAVTIPEYVDGYAVVAVGEKAFQAATIQGHFVLPGYVNTVGAGAFMDCASITDVTIEYSSTTLTDQNTAAYTNMFYNNTSLKTVTLNRNISSRTGSAYAPFSYQHTLTTITIGEHVSSIPDMMFRDDKYNYTITSVTCYAVSPPSMSTSAAPFDRCFSSVGAVPLYVPSTSVQDYKDDTTWAGVFGDNIQEIAGYVVPDEEQPDGTLRDVTTGLYFEINDGVVSIVADASGVYTDDNLVKNDDGSYTFPSYVEDKGGTNGYVTRIDEAAFDASHISGHLVIPAHILYIGKSAFKSCTGLTEVTYEYSATALEDENGDATANYSFEGCTGVKTVNLYRNVNLGSSSRLCAPFCYTTSITTVNIGEHVTVIPSYMFRNNKNACLAEVYCYAKSVPTTTYDPFSNLPSTGCTLYVPAGYKDTYSSASYSASSYSGDSATTWGEFFTSIEEMSEELEEGTYKDIDTGLYFEINEDGTASIYHDETGVYDNNNLVAHETITNAYTLPETVQAEEGGTEYVVNRVDTEAFKSSSISGHLVVPANILYMGEGAFYGCTGLTEVTYEYSATALNEEYATNNGGNYSFGGCTGVTTVNLYRDITLPHSKYIIGPFCTVRSITKLNIGPRVTALGDYLFHYAFSTSSTPVINCYAPVPFQLGYYSFDTGSNYTFYVPNGAATAYSTLEAASDNHTAWNQSGTFTDMTDAFAITTNEGDDYAYATFYNGASAVEFFNAEATVYAATSVEIEDGVGNVYIEDLGSVVPAATAVLVETNGAQTMLAIATTEEVTAPTTNYLYGYDTATTITTPTDCVYYMLTYGANGGSLGFYWGVDGGGAFTSAAHKAYLAIPSDIANKASGISIKKDADGDTTGISSVEANEGAKVSGIYTIQGVRVSSMSQPGLYIVDGKKVLVK